MTMAEQLTQSETNDRVFTFRDSNGATVLFDRITGQSCAVADTCPLRADYGDEDDKGGCQHPSGRCGPGGCSAC